MEGRERVPRGRDDGPTYCNALLLITPVLFELFRFENMLGFGIKFL